ncbi:MAG: ribosome small subunit-dependent GTPase, partial [Acidobacteria bacterium]|nr:ribosome small subunit-dependent GTPase [Acidobacteriota bacterium]
ELIVAPAGWLLMDLPGIREVRPWNESGVDEAFEDVEQIIAQCKFSDCKHGTEPGCAVRQALEEESLERARFDNYLKVRSEMATLDQQRAKRANIEDQKKLRKLHKTQRDRSKRRN